MTEPKRGPPIHCYESIFDAPFMRRVEVDSSEANEPLLRGEHRFLVWTCPSCGWRQNADKPRICGRNGEPCNGDRSWDLDTRKKEGK
jgi:hypothetical protein